MRRLGTLIFLLRAADCTGAGVRGHDFTGYVFSKLAVGGQPPSTRLLVSQRVRLRGRGDVFFLLTRTGSMGSALPA